MIREFVSLKPPCMDPDEFTRWEQLNRMSGPHRNLSVCADCLRSFAEEMRLAGRCDGEPGESAAGRRLEVYVDPRTARKRRSWRESSRRYRAAR